MKPTVGRLVHYKLTAEDADAVNRRRTNGASLVERIGAGQWPSRSTGAQTHIGNSATEGDVLPMIIVRVWPNEFGEGIPGVNAQVFLDGSDSLWVTSAKEGTAPGEWSWPPRE